MIKFIKGMTITIFCFIPLSISALEINQRLMPSSPQIAPLPNTNYHEAPTLKQYQPKVIIPKAPNYKKDNSPRLNHETWCAQRYQSYERGNNTYALPTGERVPCVSP